MSKNWMSRLQKLEGAITEYVNPYDTVIRTPSPSVNFTFGNTHGLPFGYTLALYGPPKGGKSLICNSMISQLHQDDPEAVVLKYNTEFREQGQLQLDEKEFKWNIDRKRYMAFETNTPEGIFDAIEQDVAAICQEGTKVRLIIIDSITSIQGRRALNAKSISTQQIGDHALTVQEGLKRILPVQRKNKIGMILTCQVRAEMDIAEQMRGNKLKMSASFGVQHHCEYFMYVERNRTKEGRMDLNGNDFKSTTLSDTFGNAENLAHKIRVCMKDSSMGPPGRMGEFTLDYNKGIVSVHEEVIRLGVNRGVISRPNQTSYEFGGQKWVGKAAASEAFKADPDLQKAVIRILIEMDRSGKMPPSAMIEKEPDFVEE